MPIIGHLDDFLKIPQSQQQPDVLKKLQDRQKELADIFYHKNEQDKFDTPYEKKMEIFDELTKLHQYFGYKLPKKPWKPGGKKVVTTEDRQKNCNDFIKYLNENIVDFNNLEDVHQAIILSNIWGPTN